jgi:hypothetical protein
LEGRSLLTIAVRLAAAFWSHRAAPFVRQATVVRLSRFPRFVTTRGGAYTFLPSLTAIDYLSKLD